MYVVHIYTTPPPAIPAPEEERVKLLFVGDIMPSRYVAKAMYEHGYDYPFASTTDIIKDADIAFANLESPILDGRAVRAHEMRFRTDVKFTPALARAGFDIVTLANNHARDQGEKGLQETLRVLQEEHIATVGAGTTSLAYTPTYLSAKGLVIAFVAQNDRTPVPSSTCANDTTIGTACFDIQKLQHSIVEAKSHADFVVFTMHAGDEYVPEPNALQVSYAHAAIDAGADIVIGHHPHVVESRELYNGKWIYYSLGNFVFDQNWSRETSLGLMLTVNVGKTSHTVKQFKHTIVRIDNAQPKLATEDDEMERYEILGLP